MVSNLYKFFLSDSRNEFSLGSDAHSALQMEYLKFAVINARRGWLEKKDVLNCWSLEKIRKGLEK